MVARVACRLHELGVPSDYPARRLSFFLPASRVKETLHGQVKAKLGIHFSKTAHVTITALPKCCLHQDDRRFLHLLNSS